jgi:hypothetical protein
LDFNLRIRVEDEIRGIAFIKAVVASLDANARWTPLQG